MRARNAFTAFFRLCMRVFFRRIEVVGVEHIPADGAVIFAVNHPNGLVDPLFLLCFAPRPVSFLAKAPLFGYPIIGWFARTFDSIPVYRKQDNTKGTNAETFGRAREILGRHGSIAIFPEGTTHSDPRLRELKTGAARIALGARLEKMAVVPTGIYYTAKHRFRSSALVVFGEPLPVRPATVDANGEPPADVVEELTDRIDASLDELTLQADSHAALELIGRAEDIFTATAEQPLAAEFELRRRFVEGYHYLGARDPQRLAKLQSLIAQFEAELRMSGVEVHDLSTGFRAPMLFRLVVLLPLALIGAVLHYPTYRLVGFASGRLAKEDEMVATMKFLAALAFYLLTYVAICVFVGVYVGVWEGVLTFVALPFLGWIALRFFEDLDEVIGDVRAVTHRLFRRYGHLQLVAQRERIREEMIAVAREMEGRA